MTKQIHAFLSVTFRYQFIVERLELSIAHSGERLRRELSFDRRAAGVPPRRGGVYHNKAQFDELGYPCKLGLNYLLDPGTVCVPPIIPMTISVEMSDNSNH